MKTTRILFQGIFLIVMIVALIFFRGEARDFIVGLRDIVYGIFGPSYDVKKIQDIEAENISLQKQIDLLNLKLGVRNKKDDGVISAFVYSTYPFNDKVHIIIDKGSDDGIDVGMPVMFKKGIIFGKVISVHKTQSEVQTIFDPSWKTSVVIGTSSVRAVLQGGNTPGIEFIPKDASVFNGDEILNSAPEFPMRSFIGNIRSIQEDEKKLWQIADVETPFSLDAVDSVLILTQFP
ncbi:rod shape-determining protein MreC [Candidatus Parcubacteria bacterium]|jgi:rod shape-determining protein MreC|nr:MAG: rod shape-determining protein MreC [Candidatus Parcubacteria bacterium]